MSQSLTVGDRLPEVVMYPTALQLFRYSAVTWNPHRIHFDQEWASHEGHPGVLVHSHLHAANALRTITDGLGPDWQLRRFSYRIVRPAAAGSALTATAEVTDVVEDGSEATFALRELNEQGEACLEGTATAGRRR
jgi:3-methylfumaryl-CoA hydratase